MDELKLGGYLLPPMVLEAFGKTPAWPYDDYYRAERLARLGGTYGYDHCSPAPYEHEDDLAGALEHLREFRAKHEDLGHAVDFGMGEDGPFMDASWVIPATEEEIAVAKAYIEDPANKPPEQRIKWRRLSGFTAAVLNLDNPTTKEQE